MGYVEQDLVRIARRENNTKRSYLVVNPLQGKHIPVSPKRALKLFADLADTIRNAYAGERLLLIGFAETATAIGAQAAVSLGTDYIQTTREMLADAEYLYFSEEHSHAVEQKLVKDDLDRAVGGGVNRIVFVEDEVTTGKTIQNIVEILKNEYPGKLRFSVASLLNGMSKERVEQYGRMGISLHYLVKTDHGSYGERAKAFAGDGSYHACMRGEAVEPQRLRVKGRMDARRLVKAADYERACAHLWACVREYAGPVTGERILVVGTEEFMYPAMYVGAGLEAAGNTVLCHATTRSPIAVSTEEDYPLHSRYELASLYDGERRTFLYDIGAYDRVLVLTDAPEGEESGEQMLMRALYTKNKHVTFVRWC